MALRHIFFEKAEGTNDRELETLSKDASFHRKIDNRSKSLITTVDKWRKSGRKWKMGSWGARRHFQIACGTL